MIPHTIVNSFSGGIACSFNIENVQIGGICKAQTPKRFYIIHFS